MPIYVVKVAVSRAVVWVMLEVFVFMGTRVVVWVNGFDCWWCNVCMFFFYDLVDWKYVELGCYVFIGWDLLFGIY